MELAGPLSHAIKIVFLAVKLGPVPSFSIEKKVPLIFHSFPSFFSFAFPCYTHPPPADKNQSKNRGKKGRTHATRNY